MKSMNIISRCQSTYRAQELSGELCAGHHPFVLAICTRPGRSQEELSKDICINKSNVARTLSQLEEKGYVIRKPNPADKRQSLVEPTEKMLEIYPRIREITVEWNKLIAKDIPDEDMEVFKRVLLKMEQNARNVIDKNEEVKEE